MEPLTLEPSVCTEPTEADRLARSNRNANEAVPERTTTAPELTWVFGRDGYLTAFEPGEERWVGGCSVPLLAARAMLKTLEPGTGVACFLSPTHAAQIRVALEMLSPAQALICIASDPLTLEQILHCDDFSTDLSRGRLWFAAGEDWLDELGQIFQSTPGLATPTRFIRMPSAPASVVERMIADAQRVFAEQNAHRATAIAEMRTAWRASRDQTASTRLCVIARSMFRLWDDAGDALYDALTTNGASQVDCRRFDPDAPSASSPYALALGIAGADAVIAADVSRAEALKLAADDLPWLTWVTNGRVPSIQGAGPNDKLLVTDAEWKHRAINAGWPENRVAVASWPMRQIADGLSRSPLAIIADTMSLDAPASLAEFSSHCLLWDTIAAEISRNPFVIGDHADHWLCERATAAGIAIETLNVELFLTKLILPAYQQAIANALIEAGSELRLYGAGWSDLPRFRAHAEGPVTSRNRLAEIIRDASAIVRTMPGCSAHAIDAVGRPVIRPAGSLARFVREATTSVNTSPPVAILPPISTELVLDLLRSST